MKAAVVHDFTYPLSIDNVPTPEPSSGQVLVRIEAYGLSHTDIHGAGTEVSKGDRVAVPWLGFACGHCRYCNSGRETLCEAQINTAYGMDGGYAEYVAAFERHVVKVPGRTWLLRETRLLEEVNEAFDDILHAPNKTRGWSSPSDRVPPPPQGRSVI